MFKHITTFALLVTAFLAVALMAAPAFADDFEGKVVNSGDNQLVISADGEEHTFMVGDDTKITVDGEEASLSDILAGYQVTVSADHDGENWNATAIMAFSSQ